MRFKIKELYVSGIYIFLMIVGLIEVIYYPNLDTTLSLQGYEFIFVLGLFFGLHWLMKSIKETKL